MIKDDFIKFYADTIWKCAVQNNLELLHCQYSPSNKTVEIREGSYLLQNWLTIESQDDAYKVLSNKKLFFRNEKNLLLFSDLFSCSDYNQFCYLIDNYEVLMTDISLKSLNAILPSLSLEKIKYLLENGSNHIGYLDIRAHYSTLLNNTEAIIGLNHFLDSMVGIVDIESSLATFFCNRYGQLTAQHEKTHLKSGLISVFSHTLSSFSFLPEIEKYLASQTKATFNEDTQETICVSINFSIFKEQLYISYFSDIDYKKYLLELFACAQTNNIGLSYIDVPFNKNFIYDDIEVLNLYLNFKENKLQLKRSDIENMIKCYFSYIQSECLHTKSSSDVRELTVDTKTWFNSYVENDKLEKSLVHKKERNTIKKI